MPRYHHSDIAPKGSNEARSAQVYKARWLLARFISFFSPHHFSNPNFIHFYIHSRRSDFRSVLHPQPLPIYNSLSEVKMQFSIATMILALSALSTASVIVERQNGGRVVPTGACCVANTSVKQDTCTTATGAAGRCVPGGNACEYLICIYHTLSFLLTLLS